MNLVLIGMPGCGKSTIGKKTAKEIGKTFVDLDKEIEKEAKMTIPEIFERYGESRFREIEQEVCARIAKEHGQVISCGGGIIKNAENMEKLQAKWDCIPYPTECECAGSRWKQTT